MRQQDRYLEQRISLLKKHLQERKDNLAIESKARLSLVQAHRKQKFDLHHHVHTLAWAACVLQFAEQLVELSHRGQHNRVTLKKRQQEETERLEAYIETEQASYV